MPEIGERAPASCWGFVQKPAWRSPTKAKIASFEGESWGFTEVLRMTIEDDVFCETHWQAANRWRRSRLWIDVPSSVRHGTNARISRRSHFDARCVRRLGYGAAG